MPRDFAPSQGHAQSLEGIAKALTAEAASSSTQPIHPSLPSDPAPKKSRKLVGLMLAAVVAMAAIVGGVVAVSGGGSNSDAPDQLAASSEDSPAGQTTKTDDDLDVDNAAAAEDQAPEADAASDDADQDSATDEGASASEESDAPLGERFGRYADGKFTLVGPVRDAETSAALEQAAADVIGAENVINQYVIDPRAPEVSDGRVIVDDPIYFATGSDQVSEEAFPLLDLGVVVLSIRPAATMRLTGHSDSDGDEVANVALSKARAQSIADYIVERDIDPDRIEVVGVGSSDPIADNSSAEGRAQNRRIEVEILNLLG